MAALILGFDINLLRKLQVILAVISSDHMVDVLAFKIFCRSTAMEYVDLYRWYYMPPSAHVILIHGHQILDRLFLPIGMLSEEAQEANHKNVKKFRDKFSRKTFRYIYN